MRKTALLAFGALLALAACQRGPEAEPLPEDLNSVEVGEVAVADNAMNVAVPANAANVVEPPAAPPPAFSDSEQMRDDAEATGMTARLPDEDAPGQSGNETRPAE